MRHRIAGVAVLLAALLAAWWAPGARAAPFDPHLARAPYLTDLVGTHVTVDWATDRSASSGSVVWGTFDGSTCVLAGTQAATRTAITVGALAEYQWKAPLALPGSGTYCYRVLLGTTDLLGVNPPPTFRTQVPPGSTAPFSFAVLGDWGQVDSSGDNPDQAALLAQLAASGVRFALTTGDNGYPSGSQTNYGDLLQHGSGTSAIFGPSFWTVAGSSVPVFPAPGNHGLAGTAHADLTNWPQDAAVTGSGGRYQNDTYCCVNGTSPANYASAWYAFDAGPARFYVLTSAWGDTNPGTANVYSDDAAAHFTAGTPEYDWLQHDLANHPSGLKFVFSHYPLYSDSKSQPSDTALQGPGGLAALLTQYGVNILFNGHAHIYERNIPSAPGAPVTYVTGGGGSTPAPVDGTCSAYDAYAIGWSPSKSRGSACGGASPPASAAQVFHFLKVTVSDRTVTVAPTDELGDTFDVATYDFTGTVPDTVLEASPATPANSDTATFSFHSTITPATFACSLDGAAQAPCESPVTYSGLTDGAHRLTVAATAAGGTDPTPAAASWTIDTTAPTAPGGLTATALGPSGVGLSWTASTDAGGVTAYDITRDGADLATVGPTATSFADPGAAPGTTHQYGVRARDAAGNASAYSTATVTTPPVSPPVFTDGFESGSLSAWTSGGGLAVEGADTHSGAWAAEGATTNGGTYAKKTLPSTYADAYSQVWVDLRSTQSQVNLLRHRTAGDASLAYVFVTPSGLLGLRNDVAGTTTVSSTPLAAGSGWHAVALRTLVDGTSSVVEVWLDGVRVDALSSAGVDLGTAPVGRVQIGEVQTGRTYDVVFDDAGFGTQPIGP